MFTNLRSNVCSITIHTNTVLLSVWFQESCQYGNLAGVVYGTVWGRQRLNEHHLLVKYFKLILSVCHGDSVLLLYCNFYNYGMLNVEVLVLTEIFISVLVTNAEYCM